MERGEGSKSKEGKKVTALEVSSLDGIGRYVPASGETVRITVPLDVTLPEYEKIVRFAFARGYEVTDEVFKLEGLFKECSMNKPLFIQRMEELIERSKIYENEKKAFGNRNI